MPFERGYMGSLSGPFCWYLSSPGIWTLKPETWCVRTGSRMAWMGPPQGKRAPKLGPICDSSFTFEDYNTYRAHLWSPFLLRRAQDPVFTWRVVDFGSSTGNLVLTLRKLVDLVLIHRILVNLVLTFRISGNLVLPLRILVILVLALCKLVNLVLALRVLSNLVLTLRIPGKLVRTLRIPVDLVIYDFGYVSLEHLLLSRQP